MDCTRPSRALPEHPRVDDSNKAVGLLFASSDRLTRTRSLYWRVTGRFARQKRAPNGASNAWTSAGRKSRPASVPLSVRPRSAHTITRDNGTGRFCRRAMRIERQGFGTLMLVTQYVTAPPGDTALFGDMKLIGELYKPDIAFLPIGDHFTMGPETAAIAARWGTNTLWAAG